MAQGQPLPNWSPLAVPDLVGSVIRANEERTKAINSIFNGLIQGNLALKRETDADIDRQQKYAKIEKENVKDMRERELRYPFYDQDFLKAITDAQALAGQGGLDAYHSAIANLGSGPFEKYMRNYQIRDKVIDSYINPAYQRGQTYQNDLATREEKAAQTSLHRLGADKLTYELADLKRKEDLTQKQEAFYKDYAKNARNYDIAFQGLLSEDANVRSRAFQILREATGINNPVDLINLKKTLQTAFPIQQTTMDTLTGYAGNVAEMLKQAGGKIVTPSSVNLQALLDLEEHGLEKGQGPAGVSADTWEAIKKSPRFEKVARWIRDNLRSDYKILPEDLPSINEIKYLIPQYLTDESKWYWFTSTEAFDKESDIDIGGWFPAWLGGDKNTLLGAAAQLVQDKKDFAPILKALNSKTGIGKRIQDAVATLNKKVVERWGLGNQMPTLPQMVDELDEQIEKIVNETNLNKKVKPVLKKAIIEMLKGNLRELPLQYNDR